MARILSICAILLFFLVPLDAQETKESPPSQETWKRFEIAGPFMGVKFGFVIFAPDLETARQGVLRAFERIRELEDCMSDYDPESELSRICRLARKDQPVKVSRELMEVLMLSDRIHKISGGSFDPTIAPLSRRWRQARKKKQLPSRQEIEELRELTGWNHLRLDPVNRTVTFDQSGMSLDLGGIAKGFAADEALKVLRDLGLKSCLVDAGGDVTVGEAPPGKRGWKIAVSSEEGRKLVLVNASVATSGDRFQFIEHLGRRYSHIIDPQTGWGITDRRLVTVVVQNPSKAQKASLGSHLSRAGAIADGWASAVSVMSLEMIKQSSDGLPISGLQITRITGDSQQNLMRTGLLAK